MDEINSLRIGLEFVLRWEGSYSNDPKDPGGETKWGISKRAYPNLDIKNLTPEQALNIYIEDYWKKADCYSLEFPLSVVVFDTAVNCGVSKAKSLLQSGEKTPEAYLARREAYYQELITKKPNLRVYLTGWLNRLTDLRKLVFEYIGR